MDHLLDLVVRTYGIVGIIILAPYFACGFMWREIRAQAVKIEDKNKELLDKLTDLQNKRLDDAKHLATKMADVSQAQSLSSSETNMTLQRISDIISELTARK